MKWQSIATSPNDGREVLVYPSSCREVTVGCHSLGCWSDRLDEDEPIFPSHWMPLPKPPVLPAKPRQSRSDIAARAAERRAKAYEMRQQGMTHRAIAEELGVHVGRIPVYIARVERERRRKPQA